MSVITTLSFNGQTEAAIALYEDALGAEVLFKMRFRDAPDQTFSQPGMENLIFHATFRILGTVIKASDVGYANVDSKPDFKGFALALQMHSPDAARQAFDALAAGGHVVLPFGESKFTSWYGIVTDRFGVSWKLTVSDEE